MMSKDNDAGEQRPATYVHEHVSRTIGLLDLKAQIFMGFAAASLTYEMRDLETLKSIQNLGALLQKETSVENLLEIGKLAAGSISAGFLVASFLFAMLCVMPRSGPKAKGYVYFRGIAEHNTAADYAEQVIELSAREFSKAVLQDTYHLSNIAAEKAKFVERTTYSFVIGVALLLVTQVIVAIKA